MDDKFCFYIDDDFFSEPLTIQTIKDFQVLFEVSRQLEIKAFYNKNIFKSTLNKIENDNALPKFKNKVKEFVQDFLGVDQMPDSQECTQIIFSKVSDESKNQFTNATEAWSFINKILPPRKFNPHYTKHGRKKEDGNLIPAQFGESQLCCIDKKSQEHLDNAIFDLRKKAKFHVNHDQDEGLYILFPNENTPENTFHAFHNTLDKANKNIPTSIKKYFGIN